MIIESFTGVILVSVNEMKTNKPDSTWQYISLTFAYIFFIVYIAFYLAVLIICFIEWKKRLYPSNKIVSKENINITQIDAQNFNGIECEESKYSYSYKNEEVKYKY